jgi:oligopeptide/dipeptide ABC transporter ATP-binding protein
MNPSAETIKGIARMDQTTDLKPILEIRDLRKTFELPLGLIQTILRHKKEIVTAVDNVDFTVAKGETLGIVGESGCGKTTLLRCIARLYTPEKGEILFEGRDILKLKLEEMRLERRKIQVVFQDPYSSLNPRMTVRQILGEILSVHKIVPPDQRQARMEELLNLVGMNPDALHRLPSQFSGGQRQRIGIARALAMEPTVLLADEPVSALDVSIQAQVINLLMDLKQRLNLTMVFITHDLRVVRHVSDRIAVMYLGKIMEIGPAKRIFANPRHPYTRALLAAAPELDPTIRTENSALQGDPPSPIHIPTGCRFHPRCALAVESCKQGIPPLIEVEPGHLAACPITAAELHTQ